MLINEKYYFKALNRGKNGEYIKVDFYAKKEKIISVDKEEIIKQLRKQLKKELKDTGKFEKKFNELKKNLFYDIESIYIEFDPHSPSLLYKLKGTEYFNLFKNTEIRKKMLKIHKETKNKYINFDFIKKYKYVNYLLNSITNDNIKHKHYFLNWLSYVFITHKKTMNTIVFKGTEGAGKNLFYEKIIQKVFGKEQTTVISNNELVSEFNSFIENRSFIIANEVQDYTNKKSMYEKLKQWITDPNFIANGKYQKHKNVDNYANFLIFSNNDIPVPISITDRRYSVIETKNIDLKIQVEKELNIDIEEFIEKLDNEIDNFLLDLAKYKFDTKKAIKVLKNKARDAIILNTEEKTKILKRKLQEFNKEWFLNDYSIEYLFYIENEEYFNITEKLKLGNVNDDIDETHQHIINEVFEALELKNFVPNHYLRYLLYFMYSGNKELKELNKYISKLGEKTPKAIWFKNTAHKGVLFKIINNNNINNYNKNEKIIQSKKDKYNELLNKNNELKKEIENLKKENKELKTKNEELQNKENEELENFKQMLIKEKILTEEQLKKLYNKFLDDSLEKVFSLL